MNELSFGYNTKYWTLCYNTGVVYYSKGWGKMKASSMTDSVLVSYEGRIATIMLNRPDVLNALDIDTLKALTEKLKEVRNSDCDVVVLCGNGRGFCAGGDIKGMLANEDNSFLIPVMDTISELVTTLYTLPKIVISAIHGPAAGLGLSIALAGDYIIGDASAVLAMNFIGIGLIPDGGGHFFMERRVGEAKATQLIWSGKKLTAQEAMKFGLLDQVIEEDFQEKVKEKADMFLRMPTVAMIETKQIYTSSKVEALRNILKLEKEGQQKMRETADHREGVRAFLEKRPPAFQGK